MTEEQAGTKTETIKYNPTGGIENVVVTESVHSSNYLNPSEKQYHISIRVSFDDGSQLLLSESWGIGCEPNVDVTDLPSELYDAFQSRLDSYIFTSKRGEQTSKIAWLRENSDKIDIAWYRSEASRLEKKIKNRTIQNETDERTRVYLLDLANELHESSEQGGAS